MVTIFQPVNVVGGFIKPTYAQVVALKHFKMHCGDSQFNPLRVVLILGILAFALSQLRRLRSHAMCCDPHIKLRRNGAVPFVTADVSQADYCRDHFACHS